MSPTDVAVIIVNYKTADLAVESIRSLELERSNDVQIRVILVDNASGDLPKLAGAIDANRWSSWVTLVPAPVNGGFAYGNNLGLKHAYSQAIPDYIYLLNPDARVKPGATAALIRFLDANPAVGIAGSEIENLDGSQWPVAFRFPSLLSEVNEGLSIGIVSRLLQPWIVARRMGNIPEQVDWVSGSSMFIRPQVLAMIGGLDEGYFLYFEETDFCYRAKLAGFSTWYVPESRVAHLKGQSTGLTTLQSRPKRRPTYWFESRRRYFALRFGVGHAMVIDAVAVFAFSLGFVKRLLLGRADSAIPHFVRDLLSNSILRRRNRKIPPPQSPTFAA